MGTTNYTNRTNGQTMKVQMRKELVPLWNLCFQICDTKHNYPIWANKNGENWGPWGYANRAISGSNNPSGHSAALSVDMNAPYNGYSSTWQCDMPPAMVADLESLGLYWGGRYTGKYDPMHYGYCWTPADVAGHVTKAKSILGGSSGDWWDTVTPDEAEAMMRKVVKEEVGTRLEQLDPVIRDTYNNAQWTNTNVDEINGRTEQIDPVIRDTYNRTDWINDRTKNIETQTTSILDIVTP